MWHSNTGDPDDFREPVHDWGAYGGVLFYGTVVLLGEELRIWYKAKVSLYKVGGCRLGYVTSREDVYWEKPKLVQKEMPV